MKKTKFITLLSTVLIAGGLLAADVKPYPLQECIVSGNKLGSMGKVVTTVHEGQEIKFCCKPCIKKFKANPQKYLSKLK
jgi:YHS domain-containing protein